MVAISTTSGATWTWKNPVTSDVYGGDYTGGDGKGGVLVERRGQKIYIVYLNRSTGGDYTINFLNSSNGGTTWSSSIIIMQATKKLNPNLIF
jgi:hypothetical protein